MNQTDNNNLYLNRRVEIRVNFRKNVRFNTDPGKPLRLLQKGVSQDMSIRGMQVLSSVILEKGRVFDMWIPLDDQMVVKAKARVRWTQLEDTLGDSPYWIRAGISLAYNKGDDRKILSNVVADKAKLEPVLRQEAESKIGYVF